MKIFIIATTVVALALFNRAFADADTQFVRAIEGPTVLHSSIAGQWGGHTFCYLLLGESYVFWSATSYNAEDKTPTALLGQHPRPSYRKAPAVSTIRFDKPNIKGCNQPQMLRSPDGYIHVFIILPISKVCWKSTVPKAIAQPPTLRQASTLSTSSATRPRPRSPAR